MYSDWKEQTLNRQKVKGDSYERTIINGLTDLGLDVWRTKAGWTDDRGDIAGIPGCVVECKNHARPDLAGWITELQAEVANAQANTGVIIHKRHGNTDPLEQWVTTTVGLWVRGMK